ncbi:MAG: hypothetical protein ACRD08_03090 [Acidimicrobiales bacterium]
MEFHGRNLAVAMALVAVDPVDPLDSLQAALAVRAGAPPGALMVSPAPDHVVGLRGPGPGSTAPGALASSPLVHVHRIPPRAARTGVLARPLPPEVAARIGVDALWAHQAQAIDLARAGHSVVVATGTASGKSL